MTHIHANWEALVHYCIVNSTLFDYYRSDEQGLGLKWTFDAHQLGVVSVAMDPTRQSKWTVPCVV